jgi:4-alpha-glucanotransferase
VLTDEVRALRDRFRLPGMCVAVFSFAPGAEETRLHAFPPRSVAYTGTHDNDTARGWIATPPADASTPTLAAWEKEKAFALEYLATDEAGFADALVRAVYRSASTTAITPVQDVLGQGREARMNRPGIAEGNWSYRLRAGALEAEAPRLARLCELYGRTRAT